VQDGRRLAWIPLEIALKPGYIPRELTGPVHEPRPPSRLASGNLSGSPCSHVIARPLTAEELSDAVCMATGAPEPFKGVPLGTRAMQLPDGEFFASKGRYLNYDRHPFMKVFGQPDRELSCECARESEFTMVQAMEMLNGPTITAKEFIYRH
jgi:hypothetical protein